MWNELKTCPFCGGIPELYDGGENWHIYCDCGIQTEFVLEKENAIKIWNRRISENDTRGSH